jgi:hypothetical protein
MGMPVGLSDVEVEPMDFGAKTYIFFVKAYAFICVYLPRKCIYAIFNVIANGGKSP